MRKPATGKFVAKTLRSAPKIAIAIAHHPLVRGVVPGPVLEAKLRNLDVHVPLARDRLHGSAPRREPGLAAVPRKAGVIEDDAHAREVARDERRLVEMPERHAQVPRQVVLLEKGEPAQPTLVLHRARRAWRLRLGR